MWAVPLILAGCSRMPASPQAFCAAQADRDPAVKALVVQSVSNTSFHGWDELASARAGARRQCLRHQGVLASGDRGEAPAPERRDMLFDW